MLIITKMLREDYFELNAEEKADLDNVIQLAKKVQRECEEILYVYVQHLIYVIQILVLYSLHIYIG